MSENDEQWLFGSDDDSADFAEALVGVASDGGSDDFAAPREADVAFAAGAGEGVQGEGADVAFVADAAEAVQGEGADVQQPKFKIPRVRDRSELEHAYVMARAREGKLQTTLKVAEEEDLGERLQLHNDKERHIVKLSTIDLKARLWGSGKRRRFIRKLRTSLHNAARRSLKSARLSHRQYLKVALHKTIRVDDVARATGYSKKTVLRAPHAVAHNLAGMLMRWLKYWKRLAQKDAPLAVFHLRKYDSATLRLNNPVRLPYIGDLRSNQTTRPIHVQIQRRIIMIVWRLRVVELRFPVPPVPMASVDYTCNHTSLDTNPQVEPLQNEAEEIMQTASVAAMECDGSDGAFSNLKYQAWRESSFDMARHVEMCGNHTTALTDGNVEEHLGRSYVSKLRSFLTLLRAGGFFVRLIAALVPAIMGMSDLITDRLPEEGVHDYAKQLMEHSLYHFGRYTASYTEGQNDLRGRRAFKSAWEQFLRWWNGNLDRKGRVEHYTLLTRTTVADKMRICGEMAKSLANVMLRCLPQLPEHGKWTKTPRVIDFYLILEVPHDLLRVILSQAKLHIRVVFDGPRGESSHNISFKASDRGERLKESEELVQDSTTSFRFKVTLLCNNATRYLHYFFFTASKELHSPLKPNLMLDLLNPIFSHVTVALQYVASLACGMAPHLRMLWRGWRSLLHWAREKREDAKIARVTFYMAATSLHRRHVWALKTPLHDLVSCSDSRIDQSTLSDRGSRLLQKYVRECCVGSCVHKTLASVSDVAQLFTGEAALILKSLAWCMAYLLSVADAERRHLRSKRLTTNPYMTLARIVAKSSIAEWRSLSLRSARRVVELSDAILAGPCYLTCKEL